MVVLRAWGENADGQCDVPDFDGLRVLKISAGNKHSVVLLEDNTVRAWGSNKKGQCEVPGLDGVKEVPGMDSVKVEHISAGLECTMVMGGEDGGPVIRWGVMFCTCVSGFLDTGSAQ
eukprot:Hpha_TRINITY_DN16111_c6_g3::TRINITY_DN16111_c6_g3_i2::g.5480::m.5480